MPLLTIPDVSVVDEHGNKNYNHFFACTFLHMVNDAARAFKKKNCDMKTANFNETYQIPGGSNGFVLRSTEQQRLYPLVKILSSAGDSDVQYH